MTLTLLAVRLARFLYCGKTAIDKRTRKFLLT